MAQVSLIVSVLLAVIMFVTAYLDFAGSRQVLDLMRRMGRRPGFERLLGIIKILGGLGLLIGLAVPFLGLLAAAGLALYFALAVFAHSRIGDDGRAMMPAVVLFALSALATLTKIFS